MNTLAEISRIDNPVQEPEATDTTVETQVTVEPRDLIELPNGIQVYMLNSSELGGREYFEFLRISRESGTEEAIQHLIFTCFRDVSTGKPLTPEQVLDEGGIGFIGVSTLADGVLVLFPSARASVKSLQPQK
jgi:hypothetical protein